MSFYKKLFELFDQREKCALLAFSFLNVIGSLLEVLGIGAIIPIITLLTKPELIDKNPILSWIRNLLNSPAPRDFIIVMSIAFLFIIAMKNIFLCSVNYFQSLFLSRKYLSISSLLFSSYMRSPYSFHLTKNTASLQQHTECVGAVVNGLMFPLVTIFSEAVVVVAIIIALLWIDFMSTTFICLTFIAIGGLFYFFVRQKLKRWGEIRNHHRAKTIQQINQGLGGIKETKILHKEEYFIGQYLRHMSETARIDHREKVMLQTPRLFVETTTVALVVAVMLYFINQGNEPQVFLIKMSLFAVAAVRIMPSFVRISTSMSTMRIYSHALDILTNDIKTAEELIISNSKTGEDNNSIKFSSEISMKNVFFSYQGSSDAVIDDLSLQIGMKQAVAFVGQTGAGKTTTVDIIIGLLTPNSGSVYVDGQDIHSGLYSWQKQVGYIPQNIYLTDETIRRNIAFGVPDSEIDETKIQKAIILAQLEAFISTLPSGLDTEIGERGVRISGGERQRIGIARALYNDPEVLVMDEATSSLDNETERAFMEAIKTLSGKKTIIIIAHRLSTIRHCDKIFFLEKGRLLSEGTYDELLKKCPTFTKMAGVNQTTEIR